jgi:hypothetical protein
VHLAEVHTGVLMPRRLAGVETVEVVAGAEDEPGFVVQLGRQQPVGREIVGSSRSRV